MAFGISGSVGFAGPYLGGVPVVPRAGTHLPRAGLWGGSLSLWIAALRIEIEWTAIPLSLRSAAAMGLVAYVVLWISRLFLAPSELQFAALHPVMGAVDPGAPRLRAKWLRRTSLIDSRGRKRRGATRCGPSCQSTSSRSRRETHHPGQPSSWPSSLEKGRALFDIFLRPSLQRAEIRPERGLLVEYGSGMGRILRAVHEAGYRCSGVDISATMLDHSRRLLPAVTDLHVLQAGGGVPLADASADYVYSYAVLQHIPRTTVVRRAVLEMCRILKPGGLLRLQFQPGSMPFGARRGVRRGR